MIRKPRGNQSSSTASQIPPPGPDLIADLTCHHEVARQSRAQPLAQPGKADLPKAPDQGSAGTIGRTTCFLRKTGIPRHIWPFRDPKSSPEEIGPLGVPLRSNG